MADRYTVLADLRGGRNGIDSPLALPENQCVEAQNVDWFKGLIANKRGGADSVSTTGGTAFSSGIQTLIRHVPGADETAAELWGIDGAATPIVKRLTGGTSFADVTLDDAIATRPQDVVGATLNGKLFLAYDSSVDRLHVYDPSLSSARVRRVGLAATAAPTVADTGAGAYAAVIRYYKQDTIQLDGSRVVRRSELSPSVSFTPSGGGTAARVTRATFPGEGETHWRVWGSPDNTTFYNISGNIAIGTTTYDDSATPSTYSNNTAADPTGTYSLFPSGKFVASDGNRLLVLGAWETGGKNSRLYVSPVLGSSDQGDDERTRNTTTQKDFLDLNENDGGGGTGMAVLESTPYIFKYRQHFKLVPTGDVGTPYLPRRRSKSIGCIAHKTIVEGEDESGSPAIYFLSHKGPYRIGNAGLQYLGRDNEDIWRTMNLAATTVVGHAVYHSDKHQLWIWIATGSSNDPDTKMCFDTLLGRVDDQNRVRGGWSKHTGDSAAARCSTMFSNTLGASMSRDLKPYIGRASGTTVLKCDTSSTSDNSVTFEAYIKTRPLTRDTMLGKNFQLGDVYLIAEVGSGVGLNVVVDRDFGAETVEGAITLTAEGTETRVYKKVVRACMPGSGVVQLRIGDPVSTPIASAWTIDAIIAPITQQEQR